MEADGGDQSGVFAYLSDPATHGISEPVRRINTHGAAVFLAGPDVYKVKRAVRFPFMDFSTLDKRRLACERELAVNKVNAPELYLGVVPISREGPCFKLGASRQGGPIVEWAVHLRRFDENSTLDKLAMRGELSCDIIAELTHVVVRSHDRAPVSHQANAAQALAAQAGETLTAFDNRPDVFPPKPAAALRTAMRQALAHAMPLLFEREREGFVRRCHGDLHLRNVALTDRGPLLFDALEFDESLATCDILHDLAFLLMDLWTRDLRTNANLLLNRYLQESGAMERQLKGLSLLPLFLSLRAAIRAKVAVLQPGAEDHAAEALKLFDAACRFLAPARLDLIAIGGLSGSGKSQLASRLAASIGRAPGAVHLRSDVERKRLFGVRELDRLPPHAYQPEAAGRVYERLRGLASIALEAGQSVIVDAVHLCEDERSAIERIAAERQAHFAGLWLEAPLNMLMERVGKRTGDASDATEEVVAMQAKQPAVAAQWPRLDASEPSETVAAHALIALRLPKSASESRCTTQI